MKIALVAPPFIPVPPKIYGGTELFIANLAKGLKEKGHHPVVYANGESKTGAELRYIYPESLWPIKGEIYDNLRDLRHSAWAVRDASRDCDVIHLNNTPGLACTEFVDQPVAYTIHHPHVQGLSDFYCHYPAANFVTISKFQMLKERLHKLRTIHHGIDTSLYSVDLHARREHLTFLGRIAPIKGTHIAIEVAKKAGVPLKIAGEVQPAFREYFEKQIKPQVDGCFIEFLGEVDMQAKNELFRNSKALLFPIQWNEPFGLVMVEAMACGVPVLAFRGGAVEEIVREDVSGYICAGPDEMAKRARDIKIDPIQVREYVQGFFSIESMVHKYLELYEEIVNGASLPVAPKQIRPAVA